MGRYVDGFLIPIKAEKTDRYKEIATAAGEIWKEHGALEYIEAVGDDLEHEDERGSFKKSADAKDGETVIFAFIIFESREERDRINALVMEDERLRSMFKPGEENPFDYTRMAYGGFNAIVDL